MTKNVLFSAALAAALGGCAPQQILGGQAYIKDVHDTTKSVSSILRKSPTKAGYYDHVIRICDVDPQGREVNCQDTLIVETVQ